MGKHSTRGFTIIETMLVLAITGLLVASLLAGIGTSIGVQRYRDSVTSLKSTIQDQYARVNNVSNPRDSNWTCDGTGTPVVADNRGTNPGQSKCVVMGRYLSIVDGTITTASVVGFETQGADDDTALSDVALTKQNYSFGIAADSVETNTIEWDSTISLPGTSGPNSFALFILRSPTNGSLYTFTAQNTAVQEITNVSSTTLKSMIVESAAEVPGQGARTLCVNPEGTIVNERFAIYINAVSTGPSSVESRSNTTSKAAGGPAC